MEKLYRIIDNNYHILDDLCKRLQDDYNGDKPFEQKEEDRLAIYNVLEEYERVFEEKHHTSFKKEQKLVNIKTLNDLKTYLEENEWTINDCSFGGNEVGWDLDKYSNAGEDFIFSIVHNGDVEVAIKNIWNYANDFDINEHVQMWLTSNARGVPDAVTLVEDAKEIQEDLYCLAEAVYDGYYNRKTIKEIVEQDEPDICDD